jgi:hypothetical protein
MVDYTYFEDLNILREKMFSPLHHRRRPTTERRSIKRNFNKNIYGVFIFLNFIEVCHNE